jgi:hypothetical protein
MNSKGKPPSNPPGRGGESFEVVDLGEPNYRMTMPEGTRVVKATPRPEPIEVVEVPIGRRPVLSLTLCGREGLSADGIPDEVVNLVLRASRAEQALGGQGLMLMSRHSRAGVLSVLLTPVGVDPGAEARLREVADELKTYAGLTTEVRPAA